MCDWNIWFALDSYLPNATANNPQQLVVIFKKIHSIRKKKLRHLNLFLE